MPFRIEFTLDLMSADDAVQADPTAELKRILQAVSDKLEDPDEDGYLEQCLGINDLNGDRAGVWTYLVEEDGE